MSYAAKALLQQLRICERAATTTEEAEDCAFWNQWIKAGHREQQARQAQAVNFATAPAQEVEV